MPVEIKELLVRFNVTENSQGAKPDSQNFQLNSQTYKKVVRDVSEQVLRIIERKNER
jgi:hypothetical protein